MLLHADSEDSDQTGQMSRLICLHWEHRSFCWFCHAATQLILVYSSLDNGGSPSGQSLFNYIRV